MRNLYEDDLGMYDPEFQEVIELEHLQKLYNRTKDSSLLMSIDILKERLRGG